MSLTQDDVKRIARLARIETSDAEAQATQAQLNSIFDLIAAMQAVDTRVRRAKGQKKQGGYDTLTCFVPVNHQVFHVP